MCFIGIYYLSEEKYGRRNIVKQIVDAYILFLEYNYSWQDK